MAEQDNQQLMDKPSYVTLMPQSYREVKGVAQTFVASRMFGGITSDSQAFTKILAGMELGIAPFAAMRAVHVIQGQATLSANVMAAMVKRSGRYDYRVLEKTKKRCDIEFFEFRDGKRESVGKESFDMEEAMAAKLAGKDNWKTYPKSMMFARCMSNGVRTYCPDVFNGMSVYTPDELGGQVNRDGELIEGEEAVRDKPAKDEPAQQEIVDAAAPDVDQMGTVVEAAKPSRAETKKAVEAIEAEMNDEPTTQWDAHDVAVTMGATDENIIEQPRRRLDPKKTAKIYALGSRLGLDRAKLEKRVSELKDSAEASEAIAILQGDLDKQEAQS